MRMDRAGKAGKEGGGGALSAGPVECGPGWGVPIPFWWDAAVWASSCWAG